MNLFNNKSENVSKVEIRKIFQKEAELQIKKIKKISESLQKDLVKTVKKEAKKQIKFRIEEMKNAGEAAGIDTSEKMLDVIRERVEKHVIGQAKKQLRKKIDIFEKNVITLRSDKEEMEELSITDPLTKAYNRRYFDSKLKEEFKLAKKFQTKLTIILFDIDFFKQLNDTYGHIAGDKVLKDIVFVTRSVLRSNAKLFRYGGEEFVVLLSETDDKDAFFIAERVRGIIEDYEFNADESDVVIKTTVSIGVATYPLHSLDIEKLIKKADKAMYLAKQSGRNNVKLAV
jgi:diguanylate cyclase (GGDEF)-like protein